MKPNRLIAALLASIALASCSPPGGGNSVANAAAPANSFATEIVKPGLLLVDFTATWCGPCKQMKPIVDAAEKKFAGKVRVIAVDIDQNQELASRYNVSSIPFFGMFKDGQLIEHRVGAMSPVAFEKWIEGYAAAAN